MAGITALLVQKTGEPQGNINPHLYAVAAASPSAFHDVTQGSTVLGCDVQGTGCPFGTFGFQAGVGYDQATGLGSVDALNLVDAWPDFGLSSSPASLTVARSSIANTTISISPANGFNDSVSLSCTVSNSLTNVTCSIPAAPSPGGTATLAITAGATASLGLWTWPPLPWDNRAGLIVLLCAVSILLYKRQRQAPITVGAYACLLLAFGAVSCGNGSASGATTAPAVKPAPQTGTVTITATATTATKSLTIPITVQ